MWKARLLVFLAAVLLPGVMLAPVWQRAGLGAGEDDILYYFPTRTFFHDTVRSGHWPWFNPWTGLGRPFLADPQTAVAYPPTWLFAALPPLQAYPLSLWAHFSLAVWGMYRLLRANALDRRAALFGAVAFAFSGFLLAHRAHFTMQHAAAWAPLVFWRFQRYAQRAPDARRHRRPHQHRLGRSPHARRLAAAAFALTLQCLAGHVQIAALTAAGVLLFLVSRGSQPAPTPRSRPKRESVGRALHAAGTSVARWAIACTCAAGLFAVQWLPTIEYVRLCTRVQRTFADFVENSWHPAAAVGWLLPMFLGQRTPNFFSTPYWGPSHQVEQFCYAGFVPLLLAAVTLRPGWRADPRRRPWIVVGVAGLLLALGQFGPLCPLLFWIPGSSLFRCPARALLLVHLATAALAAATLDDLGTRLSPQRARVRAAVIRMTRRPILLGVALVGIPLVLLVAALPLLDPERRTAALHAVRPWNPAIWVPLLLAIASLYVLRLAAHRWQRPAWLALPILVALLDLGIIGWTIDVPPHSDSPQALTTPRYSADWMTSVRDSSQRLWVVTERIGRLPGEYVDPLDKAAANTNILQQVPSLTDYGPLQPRSYVDRFGFAPWGETTQAQTLLADTRWTRAYNVGWILLCDETWPAPADGEQTATTPAGGRLYHNLGAQGYAFLEDTSQPGAVQYKPESPSAFTVCADTWPSSSDRRPRVVISALALPGWTALLNDKPALIETAAGGLMAVSVPPGEAVTIRFAYFPPGLWWGLTIALLSAAALGAVAAGSLLRR